MTKESLLEKIASSDVVQFGFNDEERRFILGEETIPLTPEWETVAYEALKNIPKLTAEQMEDYPVVFSGITDTFALPRMREYFDSISDVGKSELFEDTKEVMADVHRSVMAMVGQSQWSFAQPDMFRVRRLDDSFMPHLALSTDTSLGPISYGQIGEEGVALRYC